jgi:hypothetical protein
MKVIPKGTVPLHIPAIGITCAASALKVSSIISLLTDRNQRAHTTEIQ